MSKHTPGPWVADGHYIRPGDKSAAIASMCCRDVWGEETQTINARLIAAAPLLLAECEAALKRCRCRGRGYYTTDCSLCGDSTFDHVCNDQDVPCLDCKCLRALLADVKGEQETPTAENGGED